MEISIRQHALESACFVVNASAWLAAGQHALIAKDTGGPVGLLSDGCFTAIVSPDGQLKGGPLKVGEGEVIADLDFAEIDECKRFMDARGHSAVPNYSACSSIECQHRISTSTAPAQTRNPYARLPSKNGSLRRRRALRLAIQREPRRVFGIPHRNAGSWRSAG
jgi:hypothetical protein